MPPGGYVIGLFVVPHNTPDPQRHGMALTIWIIAGEASGDCYGARLAAQIQQLQPDTVVRGMGGDAMRAQGVDMMVDSSELGVVGLVEVIRHLPVFVSIFRDLTARAQRERPDCVVLIDYPGFNLRFARRMKALGIRVVYYISPQVWAWGRRRIAKIATYVDRLLVIFPFETEVFRDTGLDVQFVGHPLVDILRAARDADVSRDPDTIVLLPGSRAAELQRLTGPIVECALWLKQRHPRLKFVMPLPRASLAPLARSQVEKTLAARGCDLRVDITHGDTRRWLATADAGIAASGTVTIEAAIMGLPLVVVYRLNRLTYLLARMLVRIPYFTMVNVVLKRRVYDEFLQHRVSPENVGPAVEAIMRNGERRALVERGVTECRHMLGGGRDIGRRTAQAVLDVAGQGSA